MLCDVSLRLQFLGVGCCRIPRATATESSPRNVSDISAGTSRRLIETWEKRHSVLASPRSESHAIAPSHLARQSPWESSCNRVELARSLLLCFADVFCQLRVRQSGFYTHSHTHTYTHSLSHTHTLSLSLALSLSLSLCIAAWPAPDVVRGEEGRPTSRQQLDFHYDQFNEHLQFFEVMLLSQIGEGGLHKKRGDQSMCLRVRVHMMYVPFTVGLPVLCLFFVHALCFLGAGAHIHPQHTGAGNATAPQVFV